MAEETAAPAPTDAPAEAAPDTPSPTAWLSGAREEHQSDPAFTKYQSLDAALDGQKELARMALGKAPETPPPALSDETNPEDRQAFFTGLHGAPATADDYARQSLDVPPEAGLDPAALRSILDAAAAQGIQDWQLDPVLDAYQGWILEQVTAQQQADQGAINAGMEVLEGLWHGSTERNLAIADEYITRTFGAEAPFLGQLIENKDGVVVPLKNVPEFVQMAYELGLKSGADKFVPTGANGSPMGADAAKAQIDAAYAAQRRGEMTPQEVDQVIERYGPAAHAAAGRERR